MSSAAIVLSIVYVLCLTCSVAPRALGLVSADEKPSQRLVVSLIFAVTQGLMALLGILLGRAMGHLFGELGQYLTFAMMLVVCVKLFLDAMQILKGKALYTFSNNWGFVLLAILASTNTFLLTLMGAYFLPFADAVGTVVAITMAGFLWAFVFVNRLFHPKMMKTMSFIEFSASVFLLIIALLFLFTNIFAQ